MGEPQGERVPGRRRRLWAWARPVIGVAILGLLVWQLGTGPFLEPLHRIDVWSLAAATGIAVVTTVCCAWRWRLVSRRLGSELSLGTAVRAYYLSQFLNTVLPGGVLGDVHRAVRRGRDVGDVGHGVRVVVWERTAGQVVQAVLTIAVLLVLPSPVRSTIPLIALGVAAVVLLCAVLLTRIRPRSAPTFALHRVARVAARDLRHGLLSKQAWPGVVLTSTVVVLGHTATFLIAARTAGTSAPLSQLLPLALIVLLAMSVPTNLAGWGPREGVAAWVFAVAGLGASQGVAIAVTYGVLALVATLPGAAVLATGWLRPDGADPGAHPGPDTGRLGRPDCYGQPPAPAATKGAARG